MSHRGLWLLVTIAIAGAVWAIRCTFSAPRYEGLASDHFDGERFHNLVPLTHATGGDFWRWRATRKPGPWRVWVEAPRAHRPPERVPRGTIRVTWVNHATLLIQIDGLNILTDPIWSDRCSPVSWAGPKRVRPPAVRFEDLPPIDAVLVSHNHYDHLDLPTLIRLDSAFHPRLVSGLGNQRLFERNGIAGAVDLDWWQSRTVGGVEITMVPSQHFSARGICDRDANLWGGFVIRGEAGSVYFAGDTGWGPHFEMIRERLGPPRIALLPIGAFLPKWFMAPVHISPDEAIRAHDVLGAETTIPMHYGTFQLGDDGEKEAIDRFRELAEGREGLRVLDFGESLEVGPGSTSSPGAR